MKLSQIVGPVSIGISALNGCEEDPQTFTCEEIKTEITKLQKPDDFIDPTIEGAAIRQMTKDSRILALKAAGYDQGCVNNSTEKKD